MKRIILTSKLLCIFLFALLISACADDDKADNDVTKYRLDFNYTWSGTTHPTNFPSNAHFSPLIGTTHNENISFWKLGDLASSGMESMAESGSTALLLSEITSLVGIDYTILGSSMSDSPNSYSLEFEINEAAPYVSIVSMVAPSPDWFVGVSGLKLTKDDGTWETNKTIDLQVYDAGTDDGVGFTSADADSNPKKNITRLTSDAADTDFVDGMPIIGTFTFTKL